MKRYIRLPTTGDIWKAIFKAFHDGADELQVFALNYKAFFVKQNGRALSVYYGKVTEIFSQLDHCDKEPIPELEECYALVRHESVRRTTMNGDFEKFEASAMVARIDLLKTSKIKQSLAIIRPLMVPTNPPTNVPIVIKLVILKVDALKSWGILNGGIIAVIDEKGIPKRSLLLQWLKQRQRMRLMKKPRHWQHSQVMVVRS
ncbi:Uncharacterized protein TCM_015216 [Theobroma cacao]|uniref:Uncharacterized protein n=1 Tax=Theobroma cacao TaxID=3641 RepID=A0A061G1K7_THECC|nr:Uncharacterized protein TCM_015216 [Theobroma cacao]